MKKIASCREYIATADVAFKIYKKDTLDPVAEHPMEGATAFFLHDDFLFVAYRAGTLEALRLPDMHRAVVAESPKNRIVALFARENLLCAGTEGGLVSTYFFNDAAFRHQTDYVHRAPVVSIASDGASLFVADHRARVTEYPGGRSYDFTSPRLFCGRYVFCAEGRRLYVRTRAAFGLLLEVEHEIDDLLFSELGGLLFVRTGGRTLCIDAATGETRGEYMLDDAVVANDAIINYVDGRLELIDLFFQDREMEDIVFRNVDIKEKKVTAEEFDRKYAFVQDGNSKPLARSHSRTNRIQTRQDPDETTRGGASSDSEKENLGLDRPKKQKIPDADPPSIATNPSSFRNKDANLMFYSTEGFMISIESPTSNYITVKYHDNACEPVEIKDQSRCTMGSFFGRRFVISNRTTVNFNDEWTREMDCRMVGLNDECVFVFGEMLTILDFRGEVVGEVYTADPYLFCCSAQKIAVFSRSHVTLINKIPGCKGERRDNITVPVENVTFCAFYGDVLYVRTRGMLFRLEDGLFVKECDVPGVLLAVHDGFVLTLPQPHTLLPRPAVEYSEIGRRAERTGGSCVVKKNE